MCTRMRPISDLGSAGRRCSLLDSRERVGRGGSLPCYLPPSLIPTNPPTWWESATLSLPLSPLPSLPLTHQASPLSSTPLSGEPAAGNRGLQWWGWVGVVCRSVCALPPLLLGSRFHQWLEALQSVNCGEKHVGFYFDQNSWICWSLTLTRRAGSLLGRKCCAVTRALVHRLVSGVNTVNTAAVKTK